MNLKTNLIQEKSITKCRIPMQIQKGEVHTHLNIKRYQSTEQVKNKNSGYKIEIILITDGIHSWSTLSLFIF